MQSDSGGRLVHKLQPTARSSSKYFGSENEEKWYNGNGDIFKSHC